MEDMLHAYTRDNNTPSTILPPLCELLSDYSVVTTFEGGLHHFDDVTHIVASYNNWSHI